jgi:hypothetical protein
MGEIASMILDGTLDSETFEYLGDPVGYPRTAHDEQAERRTKRTKERRERRKRSKARTARTDGGSNA